MFPFLDLINIQCIQSTNTLELKDFQSCGATAREGTPQDVEDFHVHAPVPGTTGGDDSGQEPESADSFGTRHYGNDNTEEVELNEPGMFCWV